VYKNINDFFHVEFVLYNFAVFVQIIIFKKQESLGIFIHKSMSSADRDSFTSSFPIWMVFLFLA
jgi:hypothetical protein